MNLFSIRQVAQLTGYTIGKVSAARERKQIVGRLCGGAYFFTEEEVKAYRNGEKSTPPNEKLYSPKDAAKYLEVLPYVIYKLVEDGKLTPFKAAGRGLEFTFIFTKAKLDRVRKEAHKVGNTGIPPGRKIDTKISDIIKKENGRFVVLGTRRDLSGNPLSYKTERLAREQASKLLNKPNKYKSGDRVYVSGGPTHIATITHTVSAIDRVAVIRYINGQRDTVTLKHIKGITEEQRMEEG